MQWQAHPKFMAGNYRAVVDELLAEKPKRRQEHLVSLLGALSFLGRMEEAADLFELLAKKNKHSLESIASRFFLAIGWTRRSEYQRARALFDQNAKAGADSDLERFFVHQGFAFFHFYTGRLAECLREAEQARKYSLASGHLWALCVATDGLAHVQVKTGEIHAGLALFLEARKTANKLGNVSLAAATSISRRLYQWEYGLQEESLEDLAASVAESGPENNYSHSNLALELGRQFTLRGNFPSAAAALEGVAPAIYANQNRRQEILLNLRLAELSGRKGEYFQARHFLWFSRRLLHREVDASFELSALGIERKLALAEGKNLVQLNETWRSLHTFSSTRDRNLRVRLGLATQEEENPADKIHAILREANASPSFDGRLRPLLQAGFFAEAALAAGMPAGRPSVALLPRGLGLLVQGAAIEWREVGLSALQSKILKALSGGREVNKENLVTSVWGYSYAPLRHDSMVYAAISSLRKALGALGAHLRPTEKGYVLEVEVIWTQAQADNLPVAAPIPGKFVSNLNHRQIEILEWIRAVRFVSVNDCYKKFGVSEITALRDMDGLRREGLVVRIGKARATRYGLAEGNK